MVSFTDNNINIISTRLVRHFILFIGTGGWYHPSLRGASLSALGGRLRGSVWALRCPTVCRVFLYQITYHFSAECRQKVNLSLTALRKEKFLQSSLYTLIILSDTSSSFDNSLMLYFLPDCKSCNIVNTFDILDIKPPKSIISYLLSFKNTCEKVTKRYLK